MSVFRSIVFSAVVSGLVAGSAVTIMQHFGTVPLILKAETYEHEEAQSETGPMINTADQAGQVGSRPHHDDHQHDAHEHGAHEHDAAAWKPAEGLQRHSLTAAANILTAIGFALLLAGIYALRGGAVSWREGLL